MQQLADQLSDVLALRVALPWKGEPQDTFHIYARLLLLYDESWDVGDRVSSSAWRLVFRYVTVMGAGYLCAGVQQLGESQRVERLWSALLERCQQKHGRVGLHSRMRKVLKQREILADRRRAEQKRLQECRRVATSTATSASATTTAVPISDSAPAKPAPPTQCVSESMRAPAAVMRATPALARSLAARLQLQRSASVLDAMSPVSAAATSARASKIPVLMPANVIPSGKQLARTPCVLGGRQRRSSTGPSLCFPVTPRHHTPPTLTASQQQQQQQQSSSKQCSVSELKPPAAPDCDTAVASECKETDAADSDAIVPEVSVTARDVSEPCTLPHASIEESTVGVKETSDTVAPPATLSIQVDLVSSTLSKESLSNTLGGDVDEVLSSTQTRSSRRRHRKTDDRKNNVSAEEHLRPKRSARKSRSTKVNETVLELPEVAVQSQPARRGSRRKSVVEQCLDKMQSLSIMESPTSQPSEDVPSRRQLRQRSVKVNYNESDIPGLDYPKGSVKTSAEPSELAAVPSSTTKKRASRRKQTKSKQCAENVPPDSAVVVAPVQEQVEEKKQSKRKRNARLKVVKDSF